MTGPNTPLQLRHRGAGQKQSQTSWEYSWGPLVKTMSSLKNILSFKSVSLNPNCLLFIPEFLVVEIQQIKWTFIGTGRDWNTSALQTEENINTVNVLNLNVLYIHTHLRSIQTDDSIYIPGTVKEIGDCHSMFTGRNPVLLCVWVDLEDMCPCTEDGLLSVKTKGGKKQTSEPCSEPEVIVGVRGTTEVAIQSVSWRAHKHI